MNIVARTVPGPANDTYSRRDRPDLPKEYRDDTGTLYRCSIFWNIPRNTETQIPEFDFLEYRKIPGKDTVMIFERRHFFKIPIVLLSTSVSIIAVQTGGTQSFQPARYPGNWHDCVLSAPPGTLGLAGLSLFRPPGTLGTDGTQSFQGPRYPGDWRDSVLSGLQVP